MFKDKLSGLFGKKSGGYELDEERKLRLARKSFLDGDLEEVYKQLNSARITITMAESIYQEFVDSYGAEAKQTLDVKFNLVICCFEMRDYVGAAKYGAELLRPYRDLYGYNDQNTQSLMMAFARAAKEVNLPDVSVSMWKKLYEIFEKQYGEFDDSTLMAATTLAIESKATGKTAQACKYMEIVCKIMLHNAGSRDPETRNYMDLLEEWRAEL